MTPLSEAYIWSCDELSTWYHRPNLKSAASNIPFLRKKNECGRDLHKSRSLFYEVHLSQIEGAVVRIVGEDATITVIATETAIAELPAGRSTTTLPTFQVCHKICLHRRLGSNGKRKHNYTMISTQPIQSYKRKRIVYDCN